jgi:hypothetical protein
MIEPETLKLFIVAGFMPAMIAVLTTYSVLERDLKFAFLGAVAIGVYAFFSILILEFPISRGQVEVAAVGVLAGIAVTAFFFEPRIQENRESEDEDGDDGQDGGNDMDEELSVPQF